MVIPPSTLVGQTNVQLPVASWQIRKLMVCPAVAFESVELVTLAVSVIFCVLPSFASKVGVVEKVTTFKAGTMDPPLLISVFVPASRMRVGQSVVTTSLSVEPAVNSMS